MGDESIDKIIEQSNQTYVTYNKEKTITELIQRRAETCPESIAVYYLNQTISYGELNRKSGIFAAYLRKRGVMPGDIIAVLLNRSVDIFIAILAVIKSGAAYLPIDPEYPDARVQFMLSDSHTRYAITQHDINFQPPNGCEFLYIDTFPFSTPRYERSPIVNQSNDLLYVVYTSGSTGTPKGVLIEHRALHNFIIGMTVIFDFDKIKSFVSLTTISFDIFVFESLLPLAIGKTIILADPRHFFHDVGHRSIDLLQTTPSTIRYLLEDKRNLPLLKKVKVMLIGGERFPNTLYQELRQHFSAAVYNMYGPSETTVWSTVKRLEGDERVTIGKPIANTQIYILDETLSPVGIDEEGDLYIAGDGVARGYHNRKNLTNERFIDDPFLADNRMYKTGDRAKWFSNGEIGFLGRNDTQVKIRGFRIECGEIEQEVMTFKEISACVAIPRDDINSNQYIACYYTAPLEYPVSELICYLKKSLPEYMIPGCFLYLPCLPLTPNGKIDRLALPKPDNQRPLLEEEYETAESAYEIQLISIWEKVLNKKAIGIHDNFFHLGGNSYLLNQMLLEIEQLYPGKVAITDLFAMPNIHKLSSFIYALEHPEDISTWKAMRFPDDYYQTGNQKKELISCQNRLTDHTVGRIKRCSEQFGCRATDLFTGLAAFFLSSLCGCKQMTTAISDLNEDVAYTCTLNFSNVQTSDDIAQKLSSHAQRDVAGYKPIRSFQSSDKGIYPLVCIRNIQDSTICTHYPFVITLVMDNEAWIFCLDCDENIFCSSKMASLFTNCVRFFESVYRDVSPAEFIAKRQ